VYTEWQVSGYVSKVAQRSGNDMLSVVANKNFNSDPSRERPGAVKC
jgi:hypothetical protein